MAHVLLISKEKKASKTIGAALPGSIVLNVASLADARPVLDQILSPDPAIVLLDVRGRSGAVSWLSELRQTNLPVVAIVGSPSEREACLQAGASDYLLAPLSSLEIKARLRPYLSTQYGGERRKDVNELPDLQTTQGRLRQQIAQNERLITMGRLVSGVCHELTNRMQATQGALALALEETDLSADLSEYLDICQHETQRVIKLVNRIRSIHRPESDYLTTIDTADLLNDVKVLASDEMTRHDVKITEDILPNLPPVQGREGQLHLVFLGILLNLAASMGNQGGGEIHIRAKTIGPTIQVEFFTDASLPGIPAGEKDSPDFLAGTLGLSVAQQIVFAHGGGIGVLFNNPGIGIWVSLPFS